MIAVQVEPDYDLTVVTISEKLMPDLIGQIIRQKNYGITARVLWDLRHARLNELNQEHLKQIANRIHPAMERRATRGTAVITSDFRAQAVVEEYFAIARQIFRRPGLLFVSTSRASAMAWLDEVVPLTD